MNSQSKIKINGEDYSVFASENVKRLLLRNKLSVMDIVSVYVNKPFTKKGTSNIQKVNDTNLCVLNIKAFDMDEDKEIKCFVLHCVGNYTELVPVAPNKWSVKLDCGHRAVIDETVTPIDKDHHAECYLCQKNRCVN